MSDSVTLKLTWDNVVEQFQDLVKYAAKKEIETNPSDNMVSVEDLYQEGMIKLYDCWQEWCVEKGKDMDEFGPIFRKSLFRAVSRKRGTQRNHIDLENAVNTVTSGETPEDTVEAMYRDHGIVHLQDMLDSDVARRLMAELIEPSPQTLFQVWADIKRKEMLRSQGKRVNVPKDDTVRMKHIQRALGITVKQYDVAMQEIREKARTVLRPNL